MTNPAVEAPAGIRWRAAAVDPRSAAAAVGFGAVVLLGFADGGYYDSTWRWAAVGLGAVAAIQVVLGRAPRLTPPALLALVSLTALAAWMLLSAAWGVEGTEAVRESERCVVYLAGLAALVTVATRAAARALLVGILGGCVALSSFALGQRLVAAPELDPFQGSLLREPVGYANTLGVLAAIGVVLALGLLRESIGPGRRRALFAAATLSVTALLLTSSRGAWLAAFVGLVVLGAAGLRSPRGVVAIAVAGLLLCALALSRVPLGDRPAYWGVALATATEKPLAGSGAGSFDDVWLERRPIDAFVRDAHSLYLETAAELGLVGLVLLLLVLGAPLVAAFRPRHSPVVITAVAAYAVFLVHAGLDWDWEMPVTVLAGLGCATVALGSGRRLSRP